MRSVATCLVLILVGCGGGKSGQGDSTAPEPTPHTSPAEMQARTCKGLCTAIGRCSSDGSFDASSCETACNKKPLAEKYLTAYDGCASNKQCSALPACMTKVRLSIRQEKTCNKVCDRDNVCVVQDAKKNLPPDKLAKVTEQRVLDRNRTECMVECMKKPQTAGQIKYADICLSKSSCAEYTKCVGH